MGCTPLSVVRIESKYKWFIRVMRQSCTVNSGQFGHWRDRLKPSGYRWAESGSAVMKYIDLSRFRCWRDKNICPEAAEIRIDRSPDWPELTVHDKFCFTPFLFTVCQDLDTYDYQTKCPTWVQYCIHEDEEIMEWMEERCQKTCGYCSDKGSRAWSLDQEYLDYDHFKGSPIISFCTPQVSLKEIVVNALYRQKKSI